eukprot:c6327_g1_i1.p1 GENE.c6327_g1_i1~~c6327_g1_i1.p1  ORF type:complete len:150 (+),score=59.21 c6327_g1_i1:58-507(+)
MNNLIPIVELKRRETFSAAHRLNSEYLSEEENQNIYGKCNSKNGHGHNYVVEVGVIGPVDNKTGMVINISTLKIHIQNVLNTMDHKNIDIDVPYFVENKIPSTAENIAIYIWKSLRPLISNDCELEVNIGETEKNWAKFNGKFAEKSKV